MTKKGKRLYNKITEDKDMEGKNMADKKMTKKDKYLNALFALLKRNNGVIIADKKTHYNDTEIRLLYEVLMAKERGERLISTQIAKLLGVTRSAISQVVNRLEAEGVVVRVADDVDRKIAYIEVTESTLAVYEQDKAVCADFIERVVEKFGEEKFDTLCVLFDEFMGTVEEEKKVTNVRISRRGRR